MEKSASALDREVRKADEQVAQEEREDLKKYNRLAQQKSRAEKPYKDAEEQQRRLFLREPRRNQLMLLWAEPKTRSETHYDKLSEVGRDILQYGLPADRHTYDLVNITQLDMVLLSSSWIAHPRPIVLRDSAWYTSRPSPITSEEFVRQIPSKRGDVDVQDLGNPVHIPLGTRMDVDIVKRRWKQSAGNPTSEPLNLLNIVCHNIEITPKPLLDHCGLLHETIDWVRGLALGESNAVLGKASEQPLRDTSLESCLRFQICGFAGAISGWHMDLLAPINWITLEGNGVEGKDESVLKYWAVIDLCNSTTEARQETLKAFGKQGSHWKPHHDCIRVISLVRGDCLIMPPGTIHAPISVTNCLFRGGMCWDKRIFVTHTLPNWNFILEHRDTVTNEDPQTQTPAILDVIKEDIRCHLDQYGLETEEDLRKALDLCDSIEINSTPCACTGRCLRQACSCSIYSGRHKTRGCFRACPCSCPK